MAIPARIRGAARATLTCALACAIALAAGGCKPKSTTLTADELKNEAGRLLVAGATDYASVMDELDELRGLGSPSDTDLMKLADDFAQMRDVMSKTATAFGDAGRALQQRAKEAEALKASDADKAKAAELAKLLRDTGDLMVSLEGDLGKTAAALDKTVSTGRAAGMATTDTAALSAYSTAISDYLEVFGVASDKLLEWSDGIKEFQTLGGDFGVQREIEQAVIEQL